MGNSVSVQEKVYAAARSDDIIALQSVLRDIQRQSRTSVASSGLLEFRDERSWSPLLVASARGHYKCAELLARHGANVHHVSVRPDGTTALHECVARGYDRIADLLLNYGASPFLENGRGLTAIDVAINSRNVAMVRKLETQAQFHAMLLLKVPKWANLGTEWKQRLIVVMPRFPSPVAPPGTERLVRTLMVAYKGRDQCVPVCKVWLDGAVARTVLGYKGSSLTQCALVLHRLHAPPSGAHLTGDPSSGYTLHLRQADDSPDSAAIMRHFISIVSNRTGAPATQDAPGSHTSTAEPVKPVERYPTIGVTPGETDEQLAQRLQTMYNIEAGTDSHAAVRAGSRPLPALPNPSPTQTPVAVAQVTPGPLQSGAYPSIHHGTSVTASTQSLDSGSTARPQNAEEQIPDPRPSAPLHPEQASASTGSSAGWLSGLSSAPQPPAGSVGTASAGPQVEAPSAPPAPSAPLLAHGTQASTAGPPKQPAHTDFDEDDGTCVVCMANPCEAGFLHGDSVHKCCCRECALAIKQLQNPLCPICRQSIQAFILNFY